MHIRYSHLAAAALFALTTPLAAQAAPKNALQLGRFDPSGRSYNDIWGYVAPNGNEYALLGTTQGTYVVDCTDPRQPVERAFFSGPGSTWRDIRTYQNYAYVVTEGGGGVQIIDLSNPDNPVLVKTWGTSLWRNAHNVALDTGTGHLYPCGTNNGTLIISLADPVNPVQVGSIRSPYVHDLHIQDGIAHLSAISSSRYETWDVTNPAAPVRLGQASFRSAHHTWPSRDNQICSVASESFNPGVAIMDISNPRLPRQVSIYKTGSNSASAHNAFILDRVMHVAYYSEGYRAVDLSDPANPVEVAHYDTTSSTSGYSGSWGCYPFQPSGAVYMSDSRNGLIVLASKATSDLYGVGTDGTDGVPEIHTFGSAFSGNANFAIEVASAKPNAPIAVVLGSAQGSGSVLGVQMAVDLGKPFTVLSGVTDSEGNAHLPVPIPGADNLAGEIFSQILVQDDQAAGGWAASRGLMFEIYGR